MQIEYTSSFVREANRLPKVIKSRLTDQLEYPRQDPFHPKLHTKPLDSYNKNI